jgi:hypothetical protein
MCLRFGSDPRRDFLSTDVPPSKVDPEGVAGRVVGARQPAHVDPKKSDNCAYGKTNNRVRVTL